MMKDRETRGFEGARLTQKDVFYRLTLPNSYNATSIHFYQMDRCLQFSARRAFDTFHNSPFKPFKRTIVDRLKGLLCLFKRTIVSEIEIHEKCSKTTENTPKSPD